MYYRIPLLLFLLANVSPSDANLFSRGSDVLLRSANRIRHHAAKRSLDLINDIRLAYSGVLVDQSDVTSGKAYCEYVVMNTSLTSGSGKTSPEQSSAASGTATSAASAASSTSTVSSSVWKLKENYEGDSFFDGWTFFTASDPTDGNVNYVDQSTAESSNLTGINSAGNAYIKVDTTETVSGNRDSVRITTNYTYTGALLVLDAVHIPTGCATWPAFWSDGPDWPDGGEIDIVEGVNTYTNDQVTLHTNTGCELPSSDVTSLGISGTLVDSTDCSVSGTGDAGCGVRSNSTSSFGSGFNAIGGGVYTMRWNSSGIAVWFFERSSIPSDISSGEPDPSDWGTPIANFPSSTCNTTEFFYDHNAIFDTTLCGDWAGNDWDSTGVPGQEVSCADSTGVSTCADFVANNGSAFSEAYWEIKSVKIYQTD